MQLIIYPISLLYLYYYLKGDFDSSNPEILRYYKDHGAEYF